METAKRRRVAVCKSTTVSIHSSHSVDRSPNHLGTTIYQEVISRFHSTDKTPPMSGRSVEGKNSTDNHCSLHFIFQGECWGRRRLQISSETTLQPGKFFDNFSVTQPILCSISYVTLVTVYLNCFSLLCATPNFSKIILGGAINPSLIMNGEKDEPTRSFRIRGG